MAKVAENDKPARDELNEGDIVFVRYRDHVKGRTMDPLIVSPQLRECVAWLAYECSDYLTLVMDRSTGPKMPKSGDSDAQVLCLLRSDITEFRRLS